MSAIDFQDMFPSDEACIAYLSLLKWHSGFRCPTCENNEAWEMGKGTYRCKKCHHETTVTRGTIFHDTKKPVRLWFMAMWYVVNQKNGVSTLGLQQVLGLGSYHTAWSWLHKLRTAMVCPGRDRLKGIIEIDETLVDGKHPRKQGRGAEGKVLVLVAPEETPEGIGRIRLQILKDASAASFKEAIEQMVEPGSTIKTDGWRGYSSLSKKGYVHQVSEKVGIADENKTPLVHRVAALLKRWLLGTHQGAVSQTHLSYYLDEYTFRFNRRTSRSRGKLFCRLVQQALQYSPVSNESLRFPSAKQQLGAISA